jgi:hypothetical protein
MTAEFNGRGHVRQAAKNIAVATERRWSGLRNAAGSVDLSATSGMRALARRPRPARCLRAD